MATSRIVEVLGKQALLLEEQVPDYRALAVRAVQDILRLQGAGHSDKARKDRAADVIDAMAQRVNAQRGASE